MTMQRMVNQNKGICLYPIVDWTLNDVLTFMELRKIKLPELTKKGCRGVGLTDENLLFIYEHYPDDFKRIEQIFPFARAAVLKYDYFNLKKSFRVV